eukprot:NODE_13434_length_169_cov_19.483333_g13351_i0.p2 GENE.NODE_13434_length_169_cov_19.483333_g13351_i0~~NODE_13434_length_169_cov_19.483333_g13351_i0.p2  ORF type:complete len:56 (-),score=21.18 NODE_13434_length_169_cov_19.483333_g13351_i0:2-145(-)
MGRTCTTESVYMHFHTHTHTHTYAHVCSHLSTYIYSEVDKTLKSLCA